MMFGTAPDTSHLIQYGILEEKSDIRAHVTDKTVYVFKTKEVIELIILKGNEFKIFYAYQPGCGEITGKGYLIKPDMINDIRRLNFHSWFGWDSYNEEWNTTIKGNWAVECVIELIRMGRFPFWLDVKQTADVKIDIQGTDILVVMNQRIQVKCDYPIAKTGNLAIQTHEINPLKRH